MIDKVLRIPKERALTPLALHLLRPIHPTQITLVSFGFGLAAGVAAWQEAYILGLAFWALNRLLDGLDGTVARIFQKQSDFGGYLDMLLDIVTYAVIPLGLALGIGTTAGYISMAVLLGSFYINAASWMYLAALLEKRQHGAATHGEQTTITMPGGLIEGTETVIFFCLFFLFPQAVIPLFWLMALLVLITAGQRLAWAVRHL
jgi:phosphatidylglycerophosphate synthase